MKGLSSFVFLLAFSALFSTLLLIILNAQEKIENHKQGIIFQEYARSKDLEMKNSFSQMLNCYSKIGNEEICAIEIARWAGKLENKFQSLGIRLIIWFGGADLHELDNLAGNISNSKQIAYCKNCY
ncbi:MAG: hypothetical protein AABY04_03240, partial [Candidatus Micrarchaeota archaeon]